MAAQTMFEVFAQALLPLARRGGADYLREAARTLVACFGADLAVVAERVEAFGRWRPLAAFHGGRWVEVELGAPEDVALLEARALALVATEDARWVVSSADPLVACAVVVRQPLTEPLRSGLDLIAARAAVEVTRAKAERERRRTADRLHAHQSALLRLARLPRDVWPVRLQAILATASLTLDVERVAYWSAGRDARELVCEEMFILSRGAHERGAVLSMELYPAYFTALRNSEVVVVSDVRIDERTRDLVPDPFASIGATSFMAIPVWRDSKFAGALTFTHVGMCRRWTIEEQQFACSVAETLALALEADARARAEERYRLVSEAVGEVVWEWNIAADHLEWNENLQHVFGYAGPNVGSVDDWSARIHPGDRAGVDASLRDFLGGRDASWSADYRFLRADGTTAFVRDRGVVVRGEDGRPLRMIGAMTDVTQTKSLEQRLLLAERMASMGTLAAGVAHEINNPLAYVKGNIEHVLHELRGQPSTDEDVVAALEEASEGAERVRLIVHDLRMFSGEQDGALEAVDVERVVDRAVTIASNDIRQRSRLEKVFRHPPPVEANEGRLGQVILSLLINALHAMRDGKPDKNVLRVETGVDDGGRVFVVVADTGVGIAADVLARIFDPFFTTKPVGEGTGLGLSIAHSIVRSLGGEISVDSTPGVGSTFRVMLPPAET